MPRRIHVERAIIFCPITPYLAVHILCSALAVNPQSHDRCVSRSSDELVCVLARPIVAIVRNGRERILTAPLVVVAHCICRFIITSRTHAGNYRAKITVHEHIAIRIDCCSRRIITISSPDVPAPKKCRIVDALVLIDCDVFVGYTFLSKCSYNNIARDKNIRRIKSYIAI